MSIAHLFVLFAGAWGAALLAYLVTKSAFEVIFSEALPGDVSRAFSRLTFAGMFVISTLGGVGFLSKGYRGYPEAPETTFDWFAALYNATASSGTAIISFLGVIGFMCLVLHVGLVRAKLSSK
jgi:hypothetical protein